jgi:hypothetical protein
VSRGLLSDVPEFADLDAARKDGAAFGLMVGKATLAEMSRVALEPDQVCRVGTEGIDVIMARAERIADLVPDWAIIEVWMEAAAGNFNKEVDSAALLLASTPWVDMKH